MGLMGCSILSWHENTLICCGFTFISVFFFNSFHRHSPFRQHKTKDKHEIDRMTLTVVRPGLSDIPVFPELPFPLKNCNCSPRHLYFHMGELFPSPIRDKKAEHTTSIREYLFVLAFPTERGAPGFLFSRAEVPSGRAPAAGCEQEAWMPRKKVGVVFSLDLCLEKFPLLCQ